MKLNDITFKRITREESKDILLNYHYLHRMPPLSIAYGAFYEDELIGVITYGKPPSNSLCKGIAGEQWSDRVFELNRLYTIDESPKNLESKFISYTLKDMKDNNLILVSYADKSMGHSGFVYQATNWVYTGDSPARTDIYVGTNIHSKNYTENHKNFIIRVVRAVKHRYVYLVGDKKFKKRVKKDFNYLVYDYYPKQDPTHYNKNDTTPNILYNKKTKEQFTEKEFLQNPSKFLDGYWLEYYNKFY